MRRFCLALLFVLTLPLLAVAADEVSGSSPFDSEPHYAYRIDVSGFAGSELKEEVRFAVLSGFSGAINRANNQRVIADGQLLHAIPTQMVLFEIGGIPPVGIKSLGLSVVEELVKEVAHPVSCGEVTLYLYMPQCDRFEAKLYRRYYAGLPTAQASEERYPEEHFATLSGTLHTPDLGPYINVSSQQPLWFAPSQR